MQSEPLIFVHLRLVARVSLAVGAVAVLALLGGITLLGPHGASDYAEILRTNAITGQHLPVIMTLVGLALVATAGTVTWIIALYSSYRVAGPLYRFARNLQLATEADKTPLHALRDGDPLREQEAEIDQAVTALRDHHARVARAAREVADALAHGDDARYTGAVARLKELDGKIRL